MARNPRVEAVRAVDELGPTSARVVLGIIADTDPLVVLGAINIFEVNRIEELTKKAAVADRVLGGVKVSDATMIVVRGFFDRQLYVSAIKELRHQTGSSLKEAKEFFERLKEEWSNRT